MLERNADLTAFAGNHVKRGAFIIAIVAIAGGAIMGGIEGQNQSMANGNERWIGLLQALEDKYRLLEYEVTLVVGRAESAEEVKNPKPTGQFARSHVLLERGMQRSYIENEYKSDETTDRSIRRIAAFDGTTSTQLHFMGKGPELGDYFRPKGFIGNSPLLDDDSIAWIADFALGLDIFPGFYDRGKGIACAVQNADEARIVEKPGGILEIHFLKRELIARSHKPGILPHPEGGPCQGWKKVALDMTRGGIITAIEEYTRWPNDPNEYTGRVLDVQYHQTNDGEWIPLSAIHLIGFLSKKAVRKYEYKNVLHDHLDPESHIDRFRVVFPTGTQVLDTRAGIHFEAGLPPEELLDVIEQSVETTQQQMAEGEPSQPAERGGTSSREVVAAAQRRRVLSSNWLRWLVLGILLSLLTAVGIARVWKKIKAAKSVLPLLLLGLLAIIPDAHAKEVVIPSPARATGYEIVGAGGKPIPIDQCGLNSTLFALDFYNRAYNVELVKNALRPEPNGISMQRIRQVLRGYGLDVYGRRLSNTHDLNRVFQRRSIMITAPSTHARVGHYYVVVPALEQNKAGSYLLVDPVRSVETETTEAILERLADAGGVVLVVCEPHGRTFSQAHQIQMDSELDFGELSLTSDTSCRRELTIRNTGRSPVMISRIAGSCRCFVTEWTGGLIEPRSERKIAVVLMPKAWGAGRKKSRLVVICGDGSTKVCTIAGTGLMPENRQRIVVTPKELYFDASFGNTEASAKYVYIHQPKNDIRPVRVDTVDCPRWILVEVLEQAKRRFRGIIDWLQ